MLSGAPRSLRMSKGRPNSVSLCFVHTTPLGSVHAMLWDPYFWHRISVIAHCKWITRDMQLPHHELGMLLQSHAGCTRRLWAVMMPQPLWS